LVLEILADRGVELLLLEFARALELVVLLVRGGDERLRAERTPFAGVDAQETAPIIFVAVRNDGLAAELVLRTARLVCDRAAGGGRRGAVHVGGAEVDVDAVDKLGI